MNRKTILIVGSILGVVLCCAAIAVWGIYSLLNNPAVKEGLEIAGDEMDAMFDLRQKILQEYSCKDVGIQIRNGNGLIVSLINSEFNEGSYSQQAENARDVAQFVKDNYTGKAALTHIGITFVKSNQVGPLNTNRTVSFVFELSELQ
jgi:hypothetical protein